MDPFLIKQNDQLPSITAVLSDEGGELENLDAVDEVYFILKNPKTGVVKRALATIEDSATRTVRYDWNEGDTETAGVHRGEFEIVISGRSWTYPTQGYIPINIIEDLG